MIENTLNSQEDVNQGLNYLSKKENCLANLISMINFLLKPLYNKFLWNIQLLDINYIFIISTSNIIYYMFRI